MKRIHWILLIPAIVCVLWTGNLTTLQDKKFTRLDNLAHYIQRNNPQLPDIITYHVANALITEGKESVIPLTGISKIETNFTPDAVGDGGDSVGLLQIQPKHWGVVSVNIYKQVALARTILLDVKKISRYNGSGKKARVYEAKVRKEMKVIERILRHA